jgi:hypothetical protein
MPAEVTVTKAELLEVLRANRGKHRTVFLAGVYRQLNRRLVLVRDKLS